MKIAGHSAFASMSAARSIASSSSGGSGIGRERRQQFDLGLRGQHVGRQFDPDRPRPPGAQLPERLPDDRRRVLRLPIAVRPFGERAQDADLVGDLVQQAVALADGAARDLADQRDHRARRSNSRSTSAAVVLRKPGPGTTE